MSVEIKTGVPADRVAIITQVCINAGATSVTPVSQADGSVTLIIVYPDPATMVAASVGNVAATSSG